MSLPGISVTDSELVLGDNLVALKSADFEEGVSLTLGMLRQYFIVNSKGFVLKLQVFTSDILTD